MPLAMARRLCLYTIFSLAPLLVVVTAGTLVLLGTTSAQIRSPNTWNGCSAWRRRVIVAMMRHAVERLQSSGMAAWVAMGSTLLGASVTFLELKAALASIWGTRPASGSRGQEMITGRLSGLALALGISFLLGVTMLAEAALRCRGGLGGRRSSRIRPDGRIHQSLRR